jgi:hypothetical protein
VGKAAPGLSGRRFAEKPLVIHFSDHHLKGADVRADISRFVDHMNHQMEEAATRKGDRGWYIMGVLDLISSARRHEAVAKSALTELVELSNAGNLSPQAETRLRDQIVHEAADAANYLMMAADNAAMGRSLWTDRREEIPG